MKKPPFSADENPESEMPFSSFPGSCILFCDVVIAGENSAAALKYDEDNMFAPMIVFLEKDASAAALVSSAAGLGVPVVNNIMLAKTLAFYGKTGEPIPEAAYRDVSWVFSRIGAEKFRYRHRGLKRGCKLIPFRLRRLLSVELGASLFALTGEGPGREKLLAEPLDALRKKLRRLLGLPIPPFRVSSGRNLKNDEYRIFFTGHEAGRGRLDLGWYAEKDDFIPSVPFPDIMNLPGNIRSAAKAAARMVVRHASEIVLRRTPELLGRDEVEAILDIAEQKYPVVAREVKELLDLGVTREVLRCLVGEQVSIRHTGVILETLADWIFYDRRLSIPLEQVVEMIRQSLRHQICLEYADDRLRLRVLSLEPELERGFTDRPFHQISETAPPSGGDWADVFSRAVSLMKAKGFPPVVLCSPGARFSVKEATRRKLPELAVLSYSEIPPDISIVPVCEIQLEGSLRFPRPPK